jgi:hypothetical protein
LANRVTITEVNKTTISCITKEIKMNIGDKVILWKEEFSQRAYKDQFNKYHEGYIILDEFIAIISEIKKVKGMFGNGEHEGWKAITNNGEEFTCNWNIFPDDSMTPTYYWDIVKDNTGLWRPTDAIQASNTGYIFVDIDGNKKIPMGAKICNKHEYDVTYLDECWRCRFNLP